MYSYLNKYLKISIKFKINSSLKINICNEKNNYLILLLFSYY